MKPELETTPASVDKQHSRFGMDFGIGIVVRVLVLCALALMLTACASREPEYDEDFPRITVQRAILPSGVNGAIYNRGMEMALFEDVKARRVGDILTVLLVEQNSGTKSSDTSLNQSTDLGIGVPSIGTRTYPEVSATLNSNNSFSGESGSSQSNRLNGSVAVTVVDVLPGGNLLVQGEKWIQINQGREYIRLHGIIRQRDVAPNNTILSTQVAEARIEYSGTGSTSHANVLGWVGKLIFSPLRPF
jgi:flagellar L-ring protein precursor FlgH